MNFWIFGALGAVLLTGVIARLIVYLWSCDAPYEPAGEHELSDENENVGAAPVSTGDIVMAWLYALGIVALLACAVFDFARQAALPAGCGYDFVAGVYHTDTQGVHKTGCPPAD